MSGIWKKLFLIVGVGVLILVGSSFGSAVVTETGLVNAVVPDSLEWRGFYSPHNPATLEGGFHWWPISTGHQTRSPSSELSWEFRGIPNYWEEQRRRDEDWQRQQELEGLRREFERTREEDGWQRQQELENLRRDFERKREEDKWQQRQRDFYRSYP